MPQSLKSLFLILFMLAGATGLVLLALGRKNAPADSPQEGSGEEISSIEPALQSAEPPAGGEMAHGVETATFALG